MADIHSFGVDPVSCHAFNKDRSQVAVALNGNDVAIYAKDQVGWKASPIQTLTKHDLRVTSIDWAPKSNRIVTCSADRNGYVWNWDGKTWEPVLVHLRINRAATYVRWSPRENKFAVGSGAKLVSVCYIDDANNWWLSKHIKKPLQSTVSCLDWHPNNVLLATGSTDFRTRVFSAYIKEIEDKPEPTPWGARMPLGQLMAEFPSGGWVHGVSFSPDGNRVAWVSHDSSIAVASAGGDKVASLSLSGLPLLKCLWLSPLKVVAAGYDCCPLLFEVNDNALTFVTSLDKQKKTEAGGNVSAMRKFRDMDKLSLDSGTAGPDIGTVMTTIHQNTISSVTVHSNQGDKVSKFATSGVDSKLIVWDVKALEASLGSVRLH
ncbi:actin-related protein 2/3 complex subunit 1A [Galendromus occidentalis]|uniref:Actin-related protein 2/3 complex subunit n=1 Tax=Galendromus occidentalis TaxID=34638 RepID=A0AAJ7L4K6_9ACAR|nr:actin-related protein 2/3 complex subunit 1A [Galendromus occidentalis]